VYIHTIFEYFSILGCSLAGHMAEIEDCVIDGLAEQTWIAGTDNTGWSGVGILVDRRTRHNYSQSMPIWQFSFKHSNAKQTKRLLRYWVQNKSIKASNEQRLRNCYKLTRRMLLGSIELFMNEFY